LRPWIDRLDIVERDRFEPSPEDPEANEKRLRPVVLGSVKHVLNDPNPRASGVDPEALAAAKPVRRLLALRSR